MTSNKESEITVFEYLITLFDNHETYLKQMQKGAKEFEEKTWYRAKLMMLKRLRENYIYRLRPFLQTILPIEWLKETQEWEFKNLEKVVKNKELMDRLDK